jgi:hypothetical protein
MDVMVVAIAKIEKVIGVMIKTTII